MGRAPQPTSKIIEGIAHVKISIVQVVADIPIEEAINTNWDLVVLPGGMPGKRKIMVVVCLENPLTTDLSCHTRC